MARVLIVDDEAETQELLEYNLRQAGFGVLTAGSGADALQRVRQDGPDLVLLDVNLPGMDGFEVCKSLRADPALHALPVIMVTARVEELDRVLAFEIGADDYVIKPFSPRELVARVRRLIDRRSLAVGDTEYYQHENLRIDLPRHLVEVNGVRVDLTITEFNLLVTLASRRGRVLSRDQLLRDVWGYDEEVESRTVDTHIRRLREKLGPAARYVDTVRGVGYRLAA